MDVGLLVRLKNSLRQMGWGAIILLVFSVFCFPVIWFYSRFFPRIPHKVLFWTNQGFINAPARVRSYFFCREMQRQGVNATVLAFYDHLLNFTGLPPFDLPLTRKLFTHWRATIAAIHSRAEIIVAQSPDWEFIYFTYLRIMYPFSIILWTDFDDWKFEEYFGESVETVQVKRLLRIYGLVCNGSFASSIHINTELRKYFSVVELIPTFPDLNMFTELSVSIGTESNNGVTFAWVGALFHDINIDNVDNVIFLFNALAPLIRNGNCLRIIGGGPLLDVTRSKIMAMSMGEKVYFDGWKPPESIPALMAQIDIGLYYLTRHTNYTISKSPTKLFEYMACGKPTVSTNYGEAARFIDHGNTGFLAGDLIEFRYYCSVLANDPDLRVKMGRNAREKVEHEYNLSAGVRKMRRALGV